MNLINIYYPDFVIKKINDTYQTDKPQINCKNKVFKLITKISGISINQQNGILFFSDNIPYGNYKIKIKCIDLLSNQKVYSTFKLKVDDENSKICSSSELLKTDDKNVLLDNCIYSTETFFEKSLSKTNKSVNNKIKINTKKKKSYVNNVNIVPKNFSYISNSGNRLLSSNYTYNKLKYFFIVWILFILLKINKKFRII